MSVGGVRGGGVSAGGMRGRSVSAGGVKGGGRECKRCEGRGT